MIVSSTPSAGQRPTPPHAAVRAWAANDAHAGAGALHLLPSAGLRCKPMAPTPAPAAADRSARDERLAALLTEAAAGSAKAFESFYDATFGYAQALGRRLLRGDDLEDLLAEAYFQAWRSVASFDLERGSAVTWLLTIVRSRALDQLRRQQASPVQACEDVPEVAAEQTLPEDLLAAFEHRSALREALAELSTQERWVLGLAYWRELSHAAIATESGLPLGTVKSLILRAQNKLRDRLGPHPLSGSQSA